MTEAFTEKQEYSSPMDKKPLHLGLHSGLPPFVSEEADRAQLRQMPKASEPSVATLLVQRSKATQVVQTSESNPRN